MNEILNILSWVIPILVGVVFHEVAHGYVAYKLGDDTAKMEGRLSLNPVKHFDLLGTFVFPALLLITNAGFMFGWAKPVPVSYRKLLNPKRDMIFVAAAGPLANIIITIISLIFLRYYSFNPTSLFDVFLSYVIVNMVILNMILAIFNLMPFPPLDGSKILMGILPTKWAVEYAKLEKFGLHIIIGLLVIVPYIGQKFGMNWDILGGLVTSISAQFTNFLFNLVG